MPIKMILLAIAIAAVWGFNFVVIKLTLDSFPPILFSMLRFFFTAFPAIFLLKGGWWRGGGFWGEGPGAPWKLAALFGTFLGTVKYSLVFTGMDIGVSAGVASLVLQVQVFFTVLLATFLMKEAATLRDWAGLLIAFCGIGLIALTMEGGSEKLGLFFIVLAGLAWAFANITTKQAGAIEPIRFLVYSSLFVPIPTLVLSLTLEGPELVLSSLLSPDWIGIAGLSFTVLISTFFAFGAWGYLLARYPAAQVTPFALLVPVFGLSSSALILGEDFGLLRMAGSCLVMFALLLIVFKKVPLTRTKIKNPATG